MTTATTGTGTISLASAVDGYQAFAAAGVADADVVRYVIEDGDAWEIGLGTYTASGTTLTRGSIESSNADAALNLSGDAVVYVSAAAADLQELVDFADNFVLPTSDGSTGQVLQTNGAGTLSFTTISGYTDADVDTHLNTSTASSGEVLSWTGSDYDWIAAPTALTGQTDSASPFETSLGFEAGLNTTGANNTFVGYRAGKANTSGAQNVAIGSLALASNLDTNNSVAIGYASALSSNAAGNVSIGRTSFYTATTASENTAVGNNTLYALTTGVQNVAIGTGALDAATTGGRNIAIGPAAMGSGVATSNFGDNVAVGREAGFSITSGIDNTLAGAVAGRSLTTGSNNVALGNGALDAATTGGRNIAIGQDAMGLGVATAASGDNIAIGYTAGYDITSGTDNILVGDRAGTNLTTGYDNVAIGKDALFFEATTTFGNVSVGASAGAFSTSLYGVNIGADAGYYNQGAYNVGIGYQALYGDPTSKLTGARNVGIGEKAGFDLTTGATNFLGGYQAGANLTTGSNNVVLGNGALDAATTGGRNIAIGQDAMGSGVATAANGYNVSIGVEAGKAITSGTYNTLIGWRAGDALNSSLGSVAIGASALSTSSTARGTAIGLSALENATGDGNTAIGSQVGQDVSTGTNNTLVGTKAGNSGTNDLTTGSNNTLIGYQAEASSATVSNEITLGNSSITRFRVPGIQSGASDGDVLTYDAANGIMSLQTPAGGGGFTLISETSTTTASFVDVTFPAGYKVYMLVLKDVSVGDNVDMIIRRSNSSNAPMSGATDYGYSAHTTSTTVESSTGDSKWLISPQAAPAYGEFYGNGDGYSGVITFTGVRESTDYMTGVGELIYRGASTYENLKVRLVAMSTEQNNGIRILENGGGLVRAGGSILLYGLA